MPRKAQRRPSFIDLCCGAGGMSFGFRRAGWKPLFGVDTCQHSAQTFHANLRAPVLSVDLYGAGAYNSVQILTKNKRLDAVIGGPPCQGFSRAGPRKVADPRNGVLLACAQLAIRLKPSLIVFENVPNLVSPKFKPLLERALRTLRGAGYVADYCIINARHFGVPQNRPRLLVIASKLAERKAVTDVLETIRTRKGRDVPVSQSLKGLPAKGDRFLRNSILNHEPMRHSKKVERKIEKLEPGTGPLSYKKLHPDVIASTLVCGHRALPCHYRAPRTITPREAARLQRFPDTFEFKGPRGSQMLQVANAVPPPLAAAVARKLKTLL